MFDAGETYRGGPKTTCEPCKKKRRVEFQIRYNYARKKKPRIYPIHKIQSLLSGGGHVVLRDYTLYGFNSKLSMKSSISQLRKREGLNIIESGIYILR